VETGAGLVHLTDNVSHTSLVAQESSEVGLCSGVVARESFDLSSVVVSSLARQEPK
jgi:hypothetical protein